MTELDKNIKISRAIAFCFNALKVNLETTKIGLLFIAKFSNGTDIGAFEVQTVANVSEIVGTIGGDVIDGTEESDLIIIFNSETLATLNGFDTANLTESNFVDV